MYVRINYKGNIKLLNKIIKRDKAILEKDYQIEDIESRETKIKFICSCGEKNCEKTFRMLNESIGAFCKKCINYIAKYKIKQTCIKKYGVEHHSQNAEVIEHTQQTCLKKYGVKHPLQNKNVK